MKKIKILPILIALLMLLPSCTAGEGKRAQINEIITKDQTLNIEMPSEKDVFGETRISFAAAGDNIIHEAVFTDAKNNASVYASSTGIATKYRFTEMYEGISDIIKNADISYVNHETPVAGESFGISGYPDFNAPSEIGNDLSEVGFDIINIANNHMLDMKEKGLRNSINYWNEKSAQHGITMIGGYTKDDYDSIRFIEKDGVKIALLSYLTFINDSHKNSLSSSSELIIPYANKNTMTRQVGIAKENGADIIIVSMHWGTENDLKPRQSQIDYANHLASLGVDVILGTHSHTLQPVVWIDGENGHRTLCAYSLGNLLSTMHYNEYMVGGILTFDIVEDEAGARIENPLLIPTMCHYSMTRGRLKLYTLENYTEELLIKHGSQLKRAFSMSTLLNRLKDTVSSEFLPEAFK